MRNLTHTRAARVATLQALAILDTAPEQCYDALTRVAALVCDMPIALVSLIDGDRLWFKAASGVDASETTSGSSFCCEAADHDAFLEVCDAREDPRFSAIGLVTGSLGVRYYAGAPLAVNGIPIGTLCVLDRKPNQLSEKQKSALQDLALLTTSLLQARSEAFRLLAMPKTWSAVPAG